MTRPLGKALIGCSHGTQPERLTLGETRRRESGLAHFMRVWWVRVVGPVGESMPTDLSEAPANFFQEPQHGHDLRK